MGGSLVSQLLVSDIFFVVFIDLDASYVALMLNVCCICSTITNMFRRFGFV
jgi:hypothetical protein